MVTPCESTSGTGDSSRRCLLDPPTCCGTDANRVICTELPGRVDVERRGAPRRVPDSGGEMVRDEYSALGLPRSGYYQPERTARLWRSPRARGPRSSMLRLLRRAPLPHGAPPRVLGVDDWALKKRSTYGTILVDLVAQQVIDLLPDRTAATFVA